MTQTLEQALAQAQFFSDGERYVFIKLPPQAVTAAAGVIAEIGEAFCALIVDKDEVTLLIPDDALTDFASRLPGYKALETRCRLITIDVVLEPTLVGFMAHLSAALAKANIPIFPFAAYSRDHIFVAEDLFDRAMHTLQQLKS